MFTLKMVFNTRNDIKISRKEDEGVLQQRREQTSQSKKYKEE